jgi:hypothetical protein
MKREWKKHEKGLYLPPTQPVLTTVPRQSFFTISGTGDPNQEDFSNRVGVLYSLSYAIRMLPKSGVIPIDYEEYTVYPLEGIWDLTEQGRTVEKLDKSQLLYTIMIRQPDFVTMELALETIEKIRKKTPGPLIDEVRFEQLEDGLCVQMMHIGSYDDEPESFERINRYIEDHQLERISKVHKEIYLSDPRRVSTEKLKTVLRCKVKYRE